jgi:predicted Zn-dependent protease
VPLIQDGVAHGQVHDSASAARAGAAAASTGHATRPATLAPLPENLVLVGGGVDDVAGLAAPIKHGLFVPALTPGRPFETIGAARIEDGRLTGAVAPLAVELDPLAILASVEALTSRQRLVALRGHCPGGPGAATVPALRAGAGVTPIR